MLSLSDTVPSDWKYLNEGGRHIVFSYVGSPHVDFDSMVLRLRKINPDEQHTLASADNTEFTRQFHDQIISKLVPAQYLPEMHTVQLDPEWLGALARQTEPARPAVRAAKDQINVNAKHGIVCADLVGGKEWAVEIKPKWAFLPNPKFLSPATFSTKTKHCRFCIHSAVRSSKGKGAATGYCPLDLFSKEESRVRKALYELWDTWNNTDASTNNLRIFVSGTVIRPTDRDRLASCPSFRHPNEAHQLDLREVFVARLLPLLLETSVLDVVRELQSTLDPLGIEGLSKRCEAAQTDLARESARPADMSEWMDILKLYLNRPSSSSEEKPLDHFSVRYCVLTYVLSSIFKDCSLIIGMSLPNPILSLIDLDVKPIDRLPGWARLDRELVESYVDIDGRLCIDAFRRNQGQ